ncbi:unnamed protein product [Rhizophagus irregularis]|nr:unnamed protein product [Rhizophagus irregularis]
MENTENTNEWINWIEEAISKGVTAREIVHELKLQRDIQFHNNIIKFYGVAQFDSASAVSCLHNEGIVHRDLHSEISQGLREEPIPNTPENYIKIYTECWDGEPDKRPSINQVVERLKAIIAKINIITENYQTGLNQPTSIESIDKRTFIPTNNTDTTSNSADNLLHGEMSQVIQNFHIMNTKEIINKVVSTEENITKANIITKDHQMRLNLQSTSANEQKFNQNNIVDSSSNSDNSLHGEMSQVIQNFHIMSTKEIINKVASTEKNITKANITTKDYQMRLNPQSISADEQNFNSTNTIDTSSNADNSLHGEMSQVIQNFDIMNTREIISTINKEKIQH